MVETKNCPGFLYAESEMENNNPNAKKAERIRVNGMDFEIRPKWKVRLLLKTGCVWTERY